MSTVRQRVAAKVWQRAAAVHDRGFSSRLRHDPAAPAVVLSPHLDDAVLNCWSVLASPIEARVVNVCAAMPRRGFLSYWDRVAGGLDSAELFAMRLEEDLEALERVGPRPINLSFLESQYREGRRPPSLRGLDSALLAQLDAASIVYAPAALGTIHPDHALVRAYALSLRERGMPIRLYADAPYCCVYGWPAWVRREPAEPHLNVDAYWSASQPDALCQPESAMVVHLDVVAAKTKLDALHVYRTQFPTLNRGGVGLLENPAVHSFEVFWSLG